MCPWEGLRSAAAFGHLFRGYELSQVITSMVQGTNCCCLLFLRWHSRSGRRTAEDPLDVHNPAIKQTAQGGCFRFFPHSVTGEAAGIFTAAAGRREKLCQEEEE